MAKQFPNILDECLTRISKGETVESCLTEYSHVREQLEPLLSMASSISRAPKASPSEEFRRFSPVRLMARLRQESRVAEATTAYQRITEPSTLSLAWHRLARSISGSKRVLVPVAISLVVALVVSLGLTYAVNTFSPNSALFSNCTLSVIAGEVEVQMPSSDIWQDGTDGVVLAAGSRVRTASQSQAMITFFEGSTIMLEPGTDLEIQRLEYTDGQNTTILLKQWLGRTWSRVVTMADQGSSYEIKTPSAYALVRGTYFLTDVSETGSTRVQTLEGVVAVGGQDQEVGVGAGYETTVDLNSAPSKPTPAGPPDDAGPPGQDESGPPGKGPDDTGPPGQDESGPPGKGPDDTGPPGQDESGPPGKGPDDAGPPGQDKGDD